jgi:hypothetical protein
VVTGARWADAAAAVRGSTGWAAGNGWPACAARCGWPLDPAAANGGHDRHPGCETRQPERGTNPGMPAHRAHRPLRVIQGGKTTTRRVA